VFPFSNALAGETHAFACIFLVCHVAVVAIAVSPGSLSKRRNRRSRMHPELIIRSFRKLVSMRESAAMRIRCLERRGKESRGETGTVSTSTRCEGMPASVGRASCSKLVSSALVPACVGSRRAVVVVPPRSLGRRLLLVTPRVAAVAVAVAGGVPLETTSPVASVSDRVHGIPTALR